jgi:hypothetical protein
MLDLRIFAILLFSATMTAQNLPAGTVLPLMMSSSINEKKIKSDDKIEGKIMQDVPLSDGSKVRRGARVSGHIVEVTKAPGGGSRIVLKFDRLEDHGQTFPLNVSLLAVASMDSVAQSQLPINADASYSPSTEWVTRQVGGDVVNRGRGVVGSTTGVVGKWLNSDAVSVKLAPNPEAGCPGGDGYDRFQALWIFSSAACGAYGLDDLTVTSNGMKDPNRNIGFESDRNIDIRGGSGWLLITNAGNRP